MIQVVLFSFSFLWENTKNVNIFGILRINTLIGIFVYINFVTEVVSTLPVVSPLTTGGKFRRVERRL